MAGDFSVKMRAAAAGDLINKLATDDAFRADLQNNPKDTLAKLNIVLPDGTFGAGFKVPPKAVFRDMVGDLKIGPAGGSQQVVEVAFLAFFAFFRR